MAIHYVVPGLFGPFPQRESVSGAGRFPAVEMLLARADVDGAPFGLSATLFELFSAFPPTSRANLPTAPYGYLADSKQIPEGYLMHADPVFLRPDQDRLLLFDTERVGLTLEDAVHYANAFNAHFKSDGLTLLTPAANRWYLHWARAPEATTKPLSDVIGRNIDLFLPEGEEGPYLRQVMNETQMLFHALGVSHQRESEGKVPVSGLWFSGGGLLNERGRHGFAELDADNDPVCEGLWQYSEQVEGHDRLCVNKSLLRAVVDADISEWCSALSLFDQTLENSVNSNETIYLYACDGSVYRWNPKMVHKFWRRRKPMLKYLQQEI